MNLKEPIASNPVPNSNAVLAKQYFRVVSQYSQSWETYLRVEKLIAKSRIDIVAYYDKRIIVTAGLGWVKLIRGGSLKGLAITGVGAKTIKILEALLSKGEDTVKGEVASEKQEVFRPKSRQSRNQEKVVEYPRV